LPSDAHLVCVMDCCHSGTVLDLPYIFKADGSQSEMEIDEHFNFKKLMSKVGEAAVDKVKDKLRSLFD
jgi:metacaspase-1